MRFLAAAAFLVSLVTSTAGPSRADSAADPSATVHGYFDALGKNDFKRALALTAGEAQARTAQMVARLKKEAQQHDASVEVKVRQVRVTPPHPQKVTEQLEAGLPVPVDVQFDIEIVGKKWFFSKVARKLAGTAQFYVGNSASRIISIQGNLTQF